MQRAGKRLCRTFMTLPHLKDKVVGVSTCPALVHLQLQAAFACLSPKPPASRDVMSPTFDRY
jgi:hypothetical protein